ncbi:MAG: sulfatase-like hydrolase/transferase [Candidatus Hydrogenedentes bacterium]|nr:sulfatase-like hydrolase/transferase [Candidatus Hydrogenedentota bacterium]
MRTTRRDFLRALGQTTAGLAATRLGGIRAWGAELRSTALPNFILILADDLGWGDLPCYGNKIAQTPNLDRLASEGLRFTNFYVNGPVCSPSRVGFMTGRFPSSLAIHSHYATPELNTQRGMPQALDPNVATLADTLKPAGYVTGHFGKWHMGDIVPREYGFDEYRVVAGGGTQAWNREGDFWRRSSELVVDAALQFIEEHRAEPFFVNVWTLHPHAPLDPSEEQMDLYKRFNNGRATGKFTTPFAVFYGTVTEMDRQIGRLLAKLDELGIADNTIVLFSSDNGPEDIHLTETAHSGVGSPGPFRGRKRSLYEGGVRTPLIVRWSGQISGNAVDRTTVLSGVDFLPSLCRIVGVSIPKGLPLDGEELSDAFMGRPRQRTRPLMWERRFRVLGDPLNMSPLMAIRDGKWKLLMNPDLSRVELYDVPDDPLEVDNLADRNPRVVRRLSEKLLEWHATLPTSPIEKNAGALAYPWP